jgi:hypothetical protein
VCDIECMISWDEFSGAMCNRFDSRDDIVKNSIS